MVPTAGWKKIGIFISSTFRDMYAERDHLVHVVFPELQGRLRKHRRYIEPVDLRWGIETSSIPDAEAKSLQILEVCADEINRSRPFQLVLLGSRYGSIPPPDRLAAAARRAGLDESTETLSVTAFEVEVGLRGADSADQRCFVYCREPLPPDDMRPESAALFTDAGTGLDARDRLTELKARLQQTCPTRFHTYQATFDGALQRVTGLEPFGQRVLDDLWREFEQLIAQDGPVLPKTWEEWQEWQIDEFNSSLVRQFVGRAEMLAQLLAFANGAVGDGSWGWCLIGEAGCGKSTLVAKLASELDGRSCTLLMHAAGAVENGASIERLLRRWIEQLARTVGAPSELPDPCSPERLDERFEYLLARAAERTRVVLLLDALDLLEPTDRGRFLTWLPRSWPKNARLIATARSGDASWALQARGGCRVTPVPELSRDDAAGIAAAVCRSYHRTMNDRILQTLLDRRNASNTPAFGNPLWLTLVLEHINGLQEDDYARAEQDAACSPEERLLDVLSRAVGEMPTELTAAYQWLLTKARERHGDVAPLYASLLAISDFGWRSSDLRGLMGKFTGSEWSELDSAKLRRTFRAHLVERGEGHWDFLHDQMRRAVLSDEGRLPVPISRLHSGIADYLESLPVGDAIRRSALMSHYLGCADWQRAARHLASPIDDDEKYAAILATARTIVDRKAVDVAWLEAILQADGLDTGARVTVARRLRDGLPTELARAGDTKSQTAVLTLLSDFWQRLMAEQPANRAWSLEWARSTLELATAYRRLGDMEAAMGKYQEARPVLEGLGRRTDPKPLAERPLATADNDGSETGFEREDANKLAAICLCGIGDLMALTGRVGLDGAQGAYSSASRIIDESVRLFVGGTAGTALIGARLGYTFLLIGAGDGAYMQFRTALDQLKVFTGLDPSNVTLQREIALVLARQGQALLWEAAAGAAALCFKQAVDTMTELVRQDPSRRSWQIDLAYFRTWFGDALVRLDQGPAAQWSYREAQNLAGRLAAADPHNKEWQEALAEVRRRPNPAAVQESVADPASAIALKWDYDPLQGMQRVETPSGVFHGISTTSVLSAAKALDPAESVRRRREAQSGPQFAEWQNSLGRAELALQLGLDDGEAVPFPAAMQKLTRAAEAGEGRAQLALGMAFWEGTAGGRDLSTAKTWLSRAAEQGVTEAQFNLGVLLNLTGDADGAVRWWRSAAEAGFAAAQYNLGQAFERGTGVDKDAKQAADWIGKAARQGLPEGQYTLAVYLTSGFGMPADPSAAAAWYRRAADQGYLPALHNLAYLYLEGNGVPRDVRQAIVCLTKAAEDGSVGSQYDLGTILVDGKYCPPDPGTAAKWIARAAQQGDARAQYQLGVFLANGIGVARDAEKASECYRQAAAQGMPAAQHNLAYQYLQGNGVPQDSAVGLDWLRKAAARGLVNSQYDLAVILLKGEFCKPDEKEGLQWLERAQAQHFAPAQFALAVIYLNGQGVARDTRRARDLMAQAAQAGFQPAIAALPQFS